MQLKVTTKNAGITGYTEIFVHVIFHLQDF